MQQAISSAPVHTTVRSRVFYGSAERTVTFVLGTTVQQCDEAAVSAFPIVTNPHTFGLFREDGISELLPLTASIARVEGQESAPPGTVGIRENEKLILRPSTVRGGGV
jgi:hypothetical protein